MGSDTGHSEFETRNAAPRGVLWDVDGTLIDSSEFHFLSWRDTLALESFELSRERFLQDFGRRNDEILPLYFGSGIGRADIQRIADAKETLYRRMLAEDGSQALPGVLHWLERLRDTGWRQAVASSAPPANLEAILAALGIADFFAAVVSSADVSRGKPDPQVFLLAAERLGVPPERCVVVEDAPAGIEGARRAGMRVVGVLSSQTSLDADIVVPTMDDLAGDAFDGLVAA